MSKGLMYSMGPSKKSLVSPDKCAVGGFFCVKLLLVIAIFDSGYGGLTIMKEIVRALPEYEYLYLGDSARAPYGGRSKETIIDFSDRAVKYLFEEGAQLIIFACYTASALALRELQEKYLRDPKSKYKDRKILGVIKPVVEQAVHETKSGRIGVVGTQATINSGAFDVELKHQAVKADALGAGARISITSQACPLLVPLIEEHWHTKPEARSILRKYLRPLKNHNVDCLILGCTHYPHMIKDFKKMMGKRTRVLDSGKIVAQSLADYLARHPEIEKKLKRGAGRTFFTTDSTENFKKFLKMFMGESSADIKHISC